jgi:hypothetical protein
MNSKEEPKKLIEEFVSLGEIHILFKGDHVERMVEGCKQL